MRRLTKPFSKLFCRLWGHGGPDNQISIVMYGVEIMTGCLLCSAVIYERPLDQPLSDDPNFTLDCCPCVSNA